MMALSDCRPVRSLAPWLLLAAWTSAAAGEDIVWRYRVTQGAVTLTANPLTPDQLASFFTARGFSAAAIRPYAQSCGFSFGMHNDGKTIVTVPLAQWRAVAADGSSVPVRRVEDWERQWQQQQVAEAARIAFRWAQFQSENVFEPGDWIMGMATLAQPLPGRFRLQAHYVDAAGAHEINLDGLTCAHD